MSRVERISIVAPMRNEAAHIEVFVDHAPAAENVPRSLEAEGQEVLSVTAEGQGFCIRIRKRTEHRLQRGTG